MTSKWFIQKDDAIEGPISTEDVQFRLQSGLLTAQHMIWGRGMDTWQSIQWWQQELPGIAAVNAVESPPEIWHFAHGGKSHGPFLKSALVEHLKAIGSLGEVMVWTKGMKEWAPLFEFHDLLTAIGVNKRQFPRADLAGRATIRTADSTLVANLLCISEGGCGVQLDAGLVPGQGFSLEIQSPAFRETLHAKAECRYLSDGVCGIKFTQLNVEAKGVIVQYVRQGQARFVLKAA